MTQVCYCVPSIPAEAGGSRRVWGQPGLSVVPGQSGLHSESCLTKSKIKSSKLFSILQASLSFFFLICSLSLLSHLSGVFATASRSFLLISLPSRNHASVSTRLQAKGKGGSWGSTSGPVRDSGLYRHLHSLLLTGVAFFPMRGWWLETDKVCIFCHKTTDFNVCLVCCRP